MAEAISPHALSGLIGSVYDCALDPDRWDRTLGNLRDALDCESAMLFLRDLRKDKKLVSKSVGIEPSWLEQHSKYLPEINGYFRVLLVSWPSLEYPLVSRRHLPQAMLSPYAQEWRRPQGLVDIMTLFLMHTSSRLSHLGFSRHERHGLISEREIELGKLLLPHIRRAVTISNVLDARAIESTRVAQALDALSCGVVLANAEGAILHANRSAEAMLRNGGPVKAANGSLSAKAPAAAKELRMAIRLAAHDESTLGKTGLAIRLSEEDAPPIFAHVLPLTGGELRSGLEPEAVAAVFIGTEQNEQEAAQAMASAYGLTPAETRLLERLLAGNTLTETAAAFGVAITTAKTHLDNIFQKTGVNRQAELVRLAARAAPPAGSP